MGRSAEPRGKAVRVVRTGAGVGLMRQGRAIDGGTPAIRVDEVADLVADSVTVLAGCVNGKPGREGNRRNRSPALPRPASPLRRSCAGRTRASTAWRALPTTSRPGPGSGGGRTNVDGFHPDVGHLASIMPKARRSPPLRPFAGVLAPSGTAVVVGRLVAQLLLRRWRSRCPFARCPRSTPPASWWCAAGWSSRNFRCRHQSASP